jgi:hypothetical protein
MEFFDYGYLLAGDWLPYSIALAVVACAASILTIRRLPNQPSRAFFLSCLIAFCVAFLLSGTRFGFSGGAEALFWNVLGAGLLAQIWLPVCAATHIIARRDRIRRR